MRVSSEPSWPELYPEAGNIHSGMRIAPSPEPMPVTISPSRRELRRADPSLSFEVTAPGHRFFDVIVATDPTLFKPEDAHRRTPKNFRSSRQDFEGVPIEIETGIYMVPRAFIREAITQEPRPTRLHYLAVAYADELATDGTYSLHPDQFDQAPFVVLAGDLSAQSLSHLLGMAVGSLGVLNAEGRVMARSDAVNAQAMPRMIGGLPVGPARRDPSSASPIPMPAPAPVHINGPEPMEPDGLPGGGTVNGATPVPPATSSNPDRPPADPPAVDLPPETSGSFVDEDYAYSSGVTEEPAFRDYDAQNGAAHFTEDGYDDGLGPLGDAFEAPPAAPAAPQDPIPELDAAPPAAPGSPPAPPLAEPEGEAWKDALVNAVIAEGAGGRYDALNLNGGFRGRMGQDNPYYQRANDGLSLGPHQANQDSGELGELLQLMQAADTATFNLTFGPSAEELVRLTNMAGPSSLEAPDGRGARVQKIENADLWEEPWLGRFREAVKHPTFQQAMRAQIIARRLEPILPMARAMGFDGRRGVAMLLALALAHGPAQAIAAARAAVNPFDTPAKLASVLEALGSDSLQAFQSASGLAPSETIDDATHAALLTALRALGAGAPVPLPDPESAMDMLVTAVGPGPAGDALLKLRVSGNFRQPAAG